MRAVRFALLVAFGIGVSSGQSDDLATKAAQARDALVAGRFDEAAARYRDLVTAHPRDVGLLKNLALAEYSAGRLREAAAHFQSVLKQDPYNAPVLFLFGMTQVKQGLPEAALGSLRKAAAADPGNAMFRFELADALNATGRSAEAVPHFRKLAAAAPSNAGYWYGLGAASLRISNMSFDELQRLHPESGYTYALMARSQAGQNELGSAFSLYRLSLASLPNLRGSHAALAEIYNKTDHADWAAVETARERALPAPDCNASHAECEFQAAHYDAILEGTQSARTAEALYWRSMAASAESEAAFARVLQLPPSVARHRLSAEIFRRQNRRAEAIEEWRAALDLSPGDPNLKLELAKSLRSNQQFDEAAKLLLNVVNTGPRSAQANYLLGDSLLALQEAEKGIPYLEAAAAEDPKALDVRASLGRAYLLAGQPEKAIPHLEAALPSDTEGDLHYLLAQACGKTGREDQARRELDERQALIAKTQARVEQRKQQYAIIAP